MDADHLQAFCPDMLRALDYTFSDTDYAALHRQAQANLDHVFSKIPYKVMTKPDIKDVYLGTARIQNPTFPDHLQLLQLLKMFNDAARVSFTGLPSSSPALNEMIFYWGLDRGHGFTIHHENMRRNIIVMVFLWASRIVRGHTRQFCAEDEAGKEEFWSGYILAWKECISGTTDNSARQAFLKI
jgi:hypothetical protein